MKRHLVLMVAAFAFSATLFAEQTVNLKTVDGITVVVSAEEVRAANARLFDDEIADLAERQRIEADIFMLAKSVLGLNLSSFEAQKFAEEMSESVKSDGEVAVLKEAITYAKAVTGLNLSSYEAQVFAKLLMHKEKAKERLAIHKNAFKFAASVSGMNLSSYEAKKYADGKAGLTN